MSGRPPRPSARSRTRPSSSRPRALQPRGRAARTRSSAASSAPAELADARARLAARLPHLRRVRERVASSRRTARASRRRDGPRARGACCCSRLRRRRRSSSPAFSRPRRRSWPRASRTRPSTATAAARAQRGRRRPGALRARGRRVPRGQRRARRALPASLLDDPDPRRQALGRRARTDRGADRRCPTSGREHVRRWFEISEGAARAPRRARRRRALFPLPDAGRRLADRGRAPRGLHARRPCARPSGTRAGSQPEHRWEDGGQALLPRAATRTRRSCADFEPFARRVGGARRARALGQLALKLTAPGDPRHLPGRRAGVPGARRPRQPPPGRLGLAPGDAAPADGRLAPAGETRKLFVTLRLLGLARPARELFGGAYEPLDAGAVGCAFLRGGDVLVARAVRAGGPRATLEAPGGQWRDVLRGEERSFDLRRGARLCRRARIRRFRAALAGWSLDGGALGGWSAAPDGGASGGWSAAPDGGALAEPRYWSSSRRRSSRSRSGPNAASMCPSASRGHSSGGRSQSARGRCRRGR